MLVLAFSYLIVRFGVRVYSLGFFLFKQKTAYEMRISDWSSDVCSSDLRQVGGRVAADDLGRIGGLIAETNRHLAGAVDHVVVGHHVAVGIDDEAGAERRGVARFRLTLR